MATTGRYEQEGSTGLAVNCYVRSLQVNKEHKASYAALARMNTTADSEAMDALVLPVLVLLL